VKRGSLGSPDERRKRGNVGGEERHLAHGLGGNQECVSPFAARRVERQRRRREAMKGKKKKTKWERGRTLLLHAIPRDGVNGFGATKMSSQKRREKGELSDWRREKKKELVVLRSLRGEGNGQLAPSCIQHEVMFLPTTSTWRQEGEGEACHHRTIG